MTHVKLFFTKLQGRLPEGGQRSLAKVPDEERQGICAQVAAPAAGSLLDTRQQELLHWRGWRCGQRKAHLLCWTPQIILLQMYHTRNYLTYICVPC